MYKLQNNAVTGLLFICMPQRNQADDKDRATESKFYLPAGVPFDANRFERIWAALFDHSVGPPK